MPRKSSDAIPDTTGNVLTPLDSIPDDVKAYVEEVYAKQQKTPGRERAVYDTADELKAEFKLMADYVAQRPAGILRIRKSPTRTKDLPKDLQPIEDRVMDFRINADLEANGARNAGNDRKEPVGAKK